MRRRRSCRPTSKSSLVLSTATHRTFPCATLTTKAGGLMCKHEQPINRREALSIGLGGLGAAATLLSVPRFLRASEAKLAPLTDLEVALRAARWIRTARIETSNGV